MSYMVGQRQGPGRADAIFVSVPGFLMGETAKHVLSEQLAILEAIFQHFVFKADFFYHFLFHGIPPFATCPPAFEADLGWGLPRPDEIEILAGQQVRQKRVQGGSRTEAHQNRLQSPLHTSVSTLVGNENLKARQEYQDFGRQGIGICMYETTGLSLEATGHVLLQFEARKCHRDRAD
ncbi:hypothetical protein MKZ38_000548 [Zalerion maritima]|uniref:Uncharacterized protein n=1 Tax=Zalerion maritima TaxID=339359 RepID=A0AAD5RRI1_9PEZI|nr:hypothetical protein MKZ38_000548 [Zalerion maritima]